LHIKILFCFNGLVQTEIISFKNKNLYLATMKLTIAFLLLITLSCGKKDNCERTESGLINEVITPKEITLGESAHIKLDFGIGNGCSNFKEIKSTQNGNTINLEIVIVSKGCICTEEYKTGSEVYAFKPTNRGKYFIQYLLNNNSLTTDTVLVK